jgi:hypothetical protein
MFEHIDDKLSRLERYHRIIDDIATVLGYRIGQTYDPEVLVEKVKKLVKVPKKNFKLCYIDKNDTAYFTTQDLATQTGDDWNDIPYEHNAGTPYDARIFYYENGETKKDEKDWNEDGTPKWEIYTLKFNPYNMETPTSHYDNSRYSVDMINAGAVAWLTGYDSTNKKHVAINAGASIEEFKEKVRQCGGKIYVLED